MEKIYRVKIIFIVLSFSIVYSCNNDKEVFSKFEQKYPSFSLDSFLISKTERFKTFIGYDLTMADSNKILSFAYITEDYDEVKKGDVYFEFYQEKKIVDDTVFVYAFDENKKLLYSFEHNENRYVPSKNAIFLKGKYYYYYKFYYPRLNDYQRQFYEDHEDSIKNNHINEIPQFEDVFGFSKDKIKSD
jgi:hypothetical protein